MIDIVDLLYENPVIMAIKDNKDLRECLKKENNGNKIVFVLYGNIETISLIVEKLKDKGKIVLVHEDLVEGLSSSYLSSSFIKKYTNADGIITTRSQNASYARKIGLISVLRFFVLDSLSYENVKETIKKANCDLIEILPGIMPKILDDIGKRTAIPIIAGGLIRDKNDVIEALNVDAVAVSSSNYNVWKM
ncbi:glycerol-3-phosphate responsive antiterminator [Anaerococcus sp. AGMB00486]|uniref:Glycerol-3-phosphate responsive antiterminator n=2 Tax=Anaerococcus TaxID=165779 RepID=A0ABX2NBL9_9FIRM|nr:MULTISPECIES: glycerol-3-phosphate responsive antiterminator [Anaerococcus]MDY3006645.1 glycerol-3-phosphate responsive antiterminator [Anaerococcus porci]MSS78112.1 glycerol-3-phosphate responsive antiterminator [Anaerococcus porci]NVF12084.1 glycerol-3-phosphate responsive antiterminator [Anaerococcus faecalis]